MNILIIAGVAGVITLLAFRLWDGRKSKTVSTGDEAGQDVGKSVAKVTSSGEREPKGRQTKHNNDKIPANYESELPYYDEYEMSVLERVGYSILAGTVLFFAGYLFYMNVILSLIIALGGGWFPKLRKKQLILKRKQNLTTQFKQALASISSSLAAGRSVEGAFTSAIDDLQMLYPNPETDILKELKWIVKKVQLNEPVEQALLDFAARSNIEDISSFAEVFVTCKRTGGDLVNVVRNTSNMIQEKLEVKNDITVLLASKKMEQKVLMVVPFLIIGYLAFTTGDFMRPMYHSLIGRVVMTIGWILIGVVWYISDRMMDIKV